MPVRAVALAQTEDRRLHLAIGYGGTGQGRIAVHDVLSDRLTTGIPVDGEVNDVALAFAGGGQLIAAAAIGNWARLGSGRFSELRANVAAQEPAWPRRWTTNMPGKRQSAGP
jgi:hypothetical protein